MTRYRSLWGVLAILGLMAVDAASVLLMAETLAAAHWVVSVVFYAVAGTIWVWPAAAITRWIQKDMSAPMVVSGARSGPAGSSARRSDKFP